ncbi:MAG: hypothetical protein OXF74_06605 [Rhodobacteraceae bacterium]|nr:hypothetical protein [Paracoccaceae bacterium]
MLIDPANAQQVTETASQTLANLYTHPLFWMELVLLAVVLVAAPVYAAWKSSSSTAGPLKGLNLPEGSVRAMLALLIVGSFVNVLLFGSNVLGSNFEQVVTAFGTLAGAVTGFYFAGRKSA